MTLPLIRLPELKARLIQLEFDNFIKLKSNFIANKK